MGRGPMGGPPFISVNRRGSKSSSLQSRSNEKGRRSFEQPATAVIGRRLRCPRPMARQCRSIVQILVTRRGPLSRSRRQSGPETAASTPYDQTRWVYCPDLGDQVSSIVHILVTRYCLLSRSWRLPGSTIWADFSYPRSPLSYVLIFLSMAT